MPLEGHDQRAEAELSLEVIELPPKGWRVL
jgi:hypothetical protein